jgi:ribonuclease HI
VKKLNPEKGVAVFTDGSCNYKDGSGGWAWVAIDSDGTMETDSGYLSDATNNRMELHAPTMALTYLHEEYDSCDVLIYSDSQYVVLGCNDKTRSRKKNPKWWKRLDSAITLHNYVEWNHVKGHSTSFYNGLADKLAGEARKEGLSVSDNHKQQHKLEG